MYLFRIWFATERAAIAKAELDAVWGVERASLKPQYRDEFDKRYPAALERVTYNIHPLCILGLRRKR